MCIRDSPYLAIGFVVSTILYLTQVHLFNLENMNVLEIQRPFHLLPLFGENLTSIVDVLYYFTLPEGVELWGIPILALVIMGYGLLLNFILMKMEREKGTGSGTGSESSSVILMGWKDVWLVSLDGLVIGSVGMFSVVLFMESILSGSLIGFVSGLQMGLLFGFFGFLVVGSLASFVMIGKRIRAAQV